LSAPPRVRARTPVPKFQQFMNVRGR
jgi:hypothetical protein